MTLRRKTTLIVGLTIASMTLLTYAFSHVVLMHSYLELESRSSLQNVARVVRALNVQRSNLSTILLGYVQWDDTYQFATDGNPLYVERNMIDLTFTDNHINVIVVLNRNLDVVWEKAFDLEAELEVPVPESLHRRFSAENRLVSFADGTTIIDGILMLSEGALLVSSQPIVTSEGTGPASGTMIWGRFLTDAEIAALGDATGLAVSLVPIDAVSSAVDVQAVESIAAGPAVAVVPLSDSVIAGYTVLDDIYGGPALLLRIEEPREIYARGQYSIAFFLLAIIISAGGFLAVLHVLLERTVLSRLSKLSEAVHYVHTTGELTTPIQVSGSDEIGSLAQGVRGMLLWQAQARDTLQEANQRLEQHVAQRTQELMQSNARLREEIAEREKVQSALAQARDQAVDALRLKTQILANVSHDARTPLTTIMLRTELFQLGRYGAISDEQRKVFDVISQNARQLLMFINNLLTEAQFSGNGFDVVREAYRPAALLDDLFNVMRPLAERKGLTLEAPALEDIPEILYGDELRLRQILTNLLDNAIKFTDAGSVSVAIRRLDQGSMQLEVADTGKGIPNEALQRIYEPFWQLDSSKTREANRGVGLGLSIVKQLAKLLGGDVTVKSELGSGTVFSVVLPLQTEKEPEDVATIHHGD